MVGWTRRSLGIFSNFKWLQHCLWGKKARQHKKLHSWKSAKSQKSSSAFHLAPEEVLPYNGIQLLRGAVWANRCVLNRRRSSEELCPGLRAISLSSTCRGRERRHLVAEYTSMLFTKWLIYWKHESLFTEILIPRGMWKKQVSSAPRKGTW